MPAFVKELDAIEFDLTVYGEDWVYAYDSRWQTCMGVDRMDFTLDARNVSSVGAAIEVAPFIQYAAMRTDRPGAPLIVTGTPLAADGIEHYGQPLTTTWDGSDQFYVRRGVAVKLGTNGTFGRAQGLLYTSFVDRGLVLRPEEILILPNNNTADKSYFPLGGGRAYPAVSLNEFKQVVIGQGNATTTMNAQMAVRFFNDPLARGEWSLLESGGGVPHIPSTANFAYNTGLVSLSTASPAITGTDFQWFEPGIAVWKTVSTANSRVLLRVITAMSYS